MSSKSRRRRPKAASALSGRPPGETASIPDTSTVASTPDGTILGLPIAKVVEIAILVVTIPLLSYLAVKVTSLDTTVTAANLPDLVKGVTTTKDRVDVLYDALPRLKVQIAEERAAAPVHIAVVTTQPVGDDANAYVHILDFDHKTRQTFGVPAAVAASPDYALKIRGAAVSLDDGATTFAAYQSFLRDAKKESVTFPATVDQKLSYAITDKPSSAEIGRTTLALSTTLRVTPKYHPLDVSATNFQAMAANFSNDQTLSITH